MRALIQYENNEFESFVKFIKEQSRVLDACYRKYEFEDFIQLLNDICDWFNYHYSINCKAFFDHINSIEYWNGIDEQIITFKVSFNDIQYNHLISIKVLDRVYHDNEMISIMYTVKLRNINLIKKEEHENNNSI